MRLILLILFLFVVPSAWAMGHTPSDIVHSPLIGKTAPDAILSISDGRTASVVGSAHGEKSILIFWATWCSNCYDELGSLYQNINTIQNTGVKISLVDLGETKEAVNKYFDKRQMKWSSFLDVDQVLQQSYSLVGIPTLIFIDEKGIVRNVTHQFPSDYQDYFGS